MTQQAPPITSQIRLLNVAANYISFAWDSVAPGYTYAIYRSVDNWATEVVLKSTIDLYSALEFYDSGLVADTSYDYKITVIGPGLSESVPVFLTDVVTFETNSYSVQSAPNVQLYNSFLVDRFENNDLSITAGDIRFALLHPSYKFDKSHEKVSDTEVAPHLMLADSNVQVWGRAPNGCGGFGCSIPAILGDFALVFDRKQKVIRISTTKGKTWYAEKVLSDMAGDPYHENIYSHNEEGMFLLGWSTIMIINDRDNIHWSNTGIHFSDPNVIFDQEVSSPDLQFRHWADYPPGVIAGRGHAIGSDNDWVYFADANIIHRCNIITKQWDLSVTTMPANFAVKEFVTFNGKVYAFCPGLGGCSEFGADPIAGIYEISSNWGSYTRVYGDTIEENSRIHPLFSNLSRDDYGMIFGVNAQHYDQSLDGASYVWPDSPVPPMASNARPIRDQLYITEGRDANPLVFTARNERWQYEEQYLYNGYEILDTAFSWPRMRVNDTNHLSVITAIQTYEDVVDLDDIYSQGTATITISPQSTTFIGYPSAVTGAILYDATSKKLIAFNGLPIKTKQECTFSWLMPDIVARGVLQTYATPPKVIEDLATIPSLVPYAERFLPDHYSYREPKFVEFLREYLKYISDGSLTNYGQLHTMLSSHDANESTVFVDMFETDLMRRNIYVDDDTRKTLNKFMYNTARDFYSIKGTVDSYKFLFRLLYGETVNVKVENTYDFTFEYDIVVGNKNNDSLASIDQEEALAIGQSISGHTMTQSDSRGVLMALIADVPSYCEVVSVVYQGMVTIGLDSFPRYTIRTINSFGSFDIGYAYELSSVDDTYYMLVNSEPKIIHSDYIADDQHTQFNFVLRLESEIPYSQYYNDVITFVHPVGFDFIGSYLLTSFITTEVPADHIETIIEYSDSVRWDNGIPLVYPDYIPDLSGDEYQFSTATYMMNDGSIKQLLKVVPHATPGAVITPPGSYYVENPPSTVYGLSVDDRRTKASPLFDGSSGRFFDRINNPDTNNAIYGSTVVNLNRCRLDRVRLKDNLAVPLDPAATQRKHVHL